MNRPDDMPSAPALETVFEQRDHAASSSARRRAVRHAHHHQPQRVVADQHAGVDRRRREGVEVIGKRQFRGTASTARWATDSRLSSSTLPGRQGATENPQWPMISVVTPWRTLLSALGLIGSVKSEWVLMSMKPGATARPVGVDGLACRAVQARADRRDAAVLRWRDRRARRRCRCRRYSVPPRIRMS